MVELVAGLLARLPFVKLAAAAAVAVAVVVALLPLFGRMISF